MIQELHDLQAASKATFEELSEGVKIPVSFGNDNVALQAARQGVAVCDRTHWGRIQVSGNDRINFLHNQSTNNFQILKPGQGCDTVFVTSTARTIDLATAYIMEDSVLLLVSPQRRQYLMQWLDRYIFFADKVKLTDVSDQTATFSLIGVYSDLLLEKLGATEIICQPYGNHKKILLGEIEVSVAVGNGLAIQGYTIIVPAEAAAKVWKLLVDNGAIALGDRVWQQLRIEQGRPVPDYELTDDYNPLEAGLFHTLSFEKGCYIGQETIARLNTYKGVKQQLWGVRLSAPVEPGTVLMVGDEKVGKLTSYTDTDQGAFGLGYVRTKAGGVGLKVKVGEVDGEIIDLPFLTHLPE
jgi:folate-binding protein YgfZ